MSARADSAEHTRERIVDAMLARFAATPYEHIRLDDIAADAGVTVQTVIRRFGGKPGLMTTVVERELGRIAAAREAAAGDSPTPAETVAALVEHYERYGDLILKTYSEAPLVPGLSELAAQGREYHVDWCRRAFDAALDPALDGVTRRRRVAQIVAICDATTWRILRADGSLTPTETESALLELLLPLLAHL
ncbi:TetR/AcrR family transcriptional regulator [Herbiconiux ginsengi]|uniref:Transcriptional regulator, TetR family n=1 Tax=Herbiconiux ginsengi TaxID=381665 RepID=A0A1H3LTN7_9MICO|nr:TetR/AcrR family transcriptional regulator [Herbiconiux ginsengi]SDY67723.1 transcriptional regulator, TetR family [Herbiconiux ginsengi]